MAQGQARRLEDIYRGVEDQGTGMSMPVNMSTPDELQVSQPERTVRRTAPVTPPRSAPMSQDEVIAAGLRAVEDQQKGIGYQPVQPGPKSTGRLPESGFLSQGDRLAGGGSPERSLGLDDGLPGPRGKSVGEPGLGASQGATARFDDFGGQPALPPAQTKGGPMEIATGGPQPLQVATGPFGPPSAQVAPPGPFGPPPGPMGPQGAPGYLTEAEQAAAALPPEQQAEAMDLDRNGLFGEEAIRRSRAGFQYAHPDYGN